MSSQKVFYSLPKTQPTLSSSSKSRIKTHQKTQHQNLTTYPSVGTFITDDKQKKYIHNMKIDYGKLLKPQNQNLNSNLKNHFNQSSELGLLLSTKNTENLKQYSLNQPQQQVIEPQPPIHALLRQKKVFYTEQLGKTVNPQSGNKHKSDKQKNKKRIISVKAYQTIRSPDLKKQNIFKDEEKTFQNTTGVKEKIMEEQVLKSERSDRKISHSRIIKTFNPTAGIQTKIITYPDLTEIFRTRQNRNKFQ